MIFFGMIFRSMLWYVEIWYGICNPSVLCHLSEHDVVQNDIEEYDCLLEYEMVWYVNVWYGAVSYTHLTLPTIYSV